MSLSAAIYLAFHLLFFLKEKYKVNSGFVLLAGTLHHLNVLGAALEVYLFVNVVTVLFWRFFIYFVSANDDPCGGSGDPWWWCLVLCLFSCSTPFSLWLLCFGGV